MGANHFSHVVYGAPVALVKDRITRWLGAKGFDPREGRPIAALDPDHERGVELRWNDRGVVVLYDRLDEHPRLLFELSRLDRPVLEYWLHDSDVWGYTLWHEGSAVAGFISDPTYFGGVEEPDGPDDLEALCRLTGSAGQEAALRKIRSGKAVFAEEIGQRFVAALGAEAAAATYGPDWPVPDGFQSEALWFRKGGWDPMAGFDLAALRFRTMDAAVDGGIPPEEVAAHEARARRAQRLAGVLQVLLWPVLLPLRLWVWWRFRHLRRRIEAEVGNLSARDAAFRVEGDRLVHPGLRCSVVLAPGAVVEDRHRHTVFPGAVFGFGAGSLHVSARALYPSAVRHLEVVGPPEAKITDETLTIGGMPARRLVVELPQGQVRRLVLVAGPEIVLVFEAWSPGPVDDAAREAFDRTVESLRFDGAG